jgi:hypothetical protein
MRELKTYEDYIETFYIIDTIENNLFLEHKNFIVYYESNNFLKTKLHKKYYNFRPKHLNNIMKITFKQRLLILRNKFIKIYKEHTQ